MVGHVESDADVKAEHDEVEVIAYAGAGAEGDVALHHEGEVVDLLFGGSAESDCAGDVGGAVEVLRSGIDAIRTKF